MDKTFNCSKMCLTEKDFSDLFVYDENGILLGKLDIFTDYGYFAIVAGKEDSKFKKMEEIYICKDNILYQLIRCMHVDRTKGCAPIWRRFESVQKILHKVHKNRFK